MNRGPWGWRQDCTVLHMVLKKQWPPWNPYKTTADTNYASSNTSVLLHVLDYPMWHTSLVLCRCWNVTGYIPTHFIALGGAKNQINTLTSYITKKIAKGADNQSKNKSQTNIQSSYHKQAWSSITLHMCINCAHLLYSTYKMGFTTIHEYEYHTNTMVKIIMEYKHYSNHKR